MRPSRVLLSLLALAGSLDTGFSFANANRSPNSVFTNRPALLPSNMGSTTTSTTLRQRPNASKVTEKALRSSGGGDNSNGKIAADKSLATLLASLWGSGGVIYILAKAIKRVVPIAMEPFAEGAVPLSQLQLG